MVYKLGQLFYSIAFQASDIALGAIGNKNVRGQKYSVRQDQLSGGLPGVKSSGSRVNLGHAQHRGHRVASALMAALGLVTVACSVKTVNADPPVDPLYSDEMAPRSSLAASQQAAQTPLPESLSDTSLAAPGVSALAAAPITQQQVPNEAAGEPAGSDDEASQPASGAQNDSEQGAGQAAYQACVQQYVSALDGVQLRYQATYKSIGVDSTRALKRRPDNHWQLSSHAEWLFMSIDETSEFLLPDWQLQRFDHHRKGMTDRHNLTVTVAPGRGEFSALARGETQVYPYEGKIYDDLNHQLKLQMDVACKPQQQRFDYLVAKRKGPKHYIYHKKGLEMVDTDAGQFEAIRLERMSDDRITSVWLAPELAYVVVKLVYNDDGEASSLSIKSKPQLPVILKQ